MIDMDREEYAAIIKPILVSAAVKKRKQNGKNTQTFRKDTVYKILLDQTSFSILEIGQGLLSLIRTDEIKVARFIPQPFQLASSVQIVLPKKELASHVKTWEALLDDNKIPLEYRGAFSRIGEKLKGFSRAQQGKILENIFLLQEHQHSLKGAQQYDVSAIYFLGSSKLLSCIAKDLKALGIDTDLFAPAYKYIAVAGNPNPRSVILVEKPHSFEAAVRADKDLLHTWISSYGFGLSLDKSKDYGGMLVNNLIEHQESLIPLTRAGSPGQIDIRALLQHENLLFWGDLDIAGMQIYTHLKKSFPQIQLSGLYRPMLTHIKKRQCACLYQGCGQGKSRHLYQQ